MRVISRSRLRIFYGSGVFLCLLMVFLATGFASESLFSRRDLEGNFFTVQALSDQEPIVGAEVFIGIHRAGKTDGQGIYNHYYTTRPRQSLTLSIRKEGFLPWSRRVGIRPGKKLKIRLHPDSIHRITMKALTERFGILSAIAGMEVYIDGDLQGTTDGKGEFVYSREEPGLVIAEIRHPQDFAKRWKSEIPLEGSMFVNRFFYPVEPEIVRVGLAPFRTNGFLDPSLQKDLNGILDSLAREISRWTVFRVLPAEEISSRLVKFGMDWNLLRERGWEDTDLRWDLDLLLLGSITREKDFVVEVEALLPEGEELFRVLGSANGSTDLESFGKTLAWAVRDQYPFGGSIREVDGMNIGIQFGGIPGWDPLPGTILHVLSYQKDEFGRRIGLNRIGMASLLEFGEDLAQGRVDQLIPGEQVAQGDQVVRYVPPPMEENAQVSITVRARTRSGSGTLSLQGVNVYLNSRWVGRTDREGRAQVLLQEGGTYRLDYYLHGFEPATKWVQATGTGEVTVDLSKYLSKFRIHSDPTGASVWVDGKLIGKTPIKEGIPVPLGWHEIRLDAGDDFHPVVRSLLFSKKVEDFSGQHKIILERRILGLKSRR